MSMRWHRNVVPRALKFCIHFGSVDVLPFDSFPDVRPVRLVFYLYAVAATGLEQYGNASISSSNWQPGIGLIWLISKC